MFLVLQRQNGHWSVGAKIIGVTDDLASANDEALLQKRAHPQQHFGIAEIVGEVREVDQPFTVVKP